MKNCNLNNFIILSNNNILVCWLSFKLTRGFITAIISFLLISCSTLPKQTYLKNNALAGISKVAVISSANTPEISYSINDKHSGLSVFTVLFGLVVFPAMLAEYSVRSGIDNQHAAEIEKHLINNRIEEKLAKSFISSINIEPRFTSIDYIQSKDQYQNKLSVKNYDAVISLIVKTITLERDVADKVSLYITVQGKMESLKSGKILLDREEVLKSKDPKELEYYKKSGIEELDAMLERAAQILAYDFVYLR